jgi:hypothetical protein
MTEIVDISHDKKVCNSPFHHPPTNIVIPPGKKMVHTCDECGEVTEVYNPITYSTAIPPPLPKWPERQIRNEYITD